MPSRRDPGLMMSTIRIAAATSTAATSGEIVEKSLQFTRRPLLPEDQVDRVALLHALDDLVHAALHEGQHEARKQAEHDDQDAERDEGHRLDGLQVDEVREVALEELGQVAEEHPLEHPEH